MIESLIILGVLGAMMLALHVVYASKRLTEHDEMFEAQRIGLRNLNERISRVELELGKRR